MTAPMTALSARACRTPLVLLFPAAAIAGFGLGVWGLAVTLPHPVSTPLPPPSLPQPATTADMPAQQLWVWPPLFGAPPPPPEPQPEPEVAILDDAPPEIDLDAYVLRGLAYEETGGWALLETEDGMFVVRSGGFLPGGEEITFITEDGIELMIDDDSYFIGFEEFDDAPERLTVPQVTAPRGGLPAERVPFDSSPDVPRAPYGLGDVGR